MGRMMISAMLLPVAFLAAPSQKKPEGLVTKEVSYASDGTTLKGYLAYNGSVKGRRPGVLVVHEWWGLNEYARMRARKLAEAGFVALAMDMYGGGKQATNPDDARKYASEALRDPSTAKAHFVSALEVLRHQQACDGRVAAVGYCFGGGVVLQMARMGVDLAGVGCFHGNLATSSPAKRGQVKAKVLVCNGADDKSVGPELITAFKKEMDGAGVDYTFINYPGAKHAFTNPEADEYGRKFDLPVAYNRDADTQSWEELGRFLARVFGN